MIKVKAYYQFIFGLDLSKYRLTEEGGIPIINFNSTEDYNEFLSNNQLEERELVDGTIIVAIPKKDAVYGKRL